MPIYRFARLTYQAPALLVLCLFATACITLDEPEAYFPADSPVYLNIGAASLRGQPMDSILIQAPAGTTVPNIPMETGLIRNTAQKTGPAVVSIYTRSKTAYRVHLLPIKLPFTHFRVNLPGVGLGSGFFIHPSGYLLTNNHVVQNAQEILGLTHEGEELQLQVIARDPAYDLALLKVLQPEREYPVLPMGDSNDIEVGEFVIAVGNPLGLGRTVTFGIISATERTLSGVDKEEGRHIHFLQTDTAINPGSSGGPLITLGGAWIGVNTAGAQGAQGIGFTVPSAQAKEFIQIVLAGKGERDQ